MIRAIDQTWSAGPLTQTLHRGCSRFGVKGHVEVIRGHFRQKTHVWVNIEPVVLLTKFGPIIDTNLVRQVPLYPSLT